MSEPRLFLCAPPTNLFAFIHQLTRRTLLILPSPTNGASHRAHPTASAACRPITEHVRLPSLSPIIESLRLCIQTMQSARNDEMSAASSESGDDVYTPRQTGGSPSTSRSTETTATDLSVSTESPSPKRLVGPIDCSICCSIMTNPSIGGSCAHHFCEDCLYEWMARGKYSCPTCRSPLTAITRDAEFAEFCGCPTSPSKHRTSKGTAESPPEHRRDVMLCPPTGLWLANSASGNGAVIVKVKSGCGAYRAKMRVGDIITRINGVEVRDHKTAIKLIERNGRSGGTRVDVLCRSKDESSPSPWREFPVESVGAI